MSQQTKVILRTLTTIMVGAALVLAFLISAIRIFGFEIYGVLTGSMEPTYPVGSLIYVRQVDPDDLKLRDVITFNVSAKVVATHRIVEIIEPDETSSYRRFRTKGDANENADANLVGPAEIIGRVSFSVPHLGNLANYIQHPPGIYVAIGVSLLLIVFVFMTDSLTNENEKKSGKMEQRVEMPWLTDLLAKVGITWPKPAQQPQQPQYQQQYAQQPQYQQPQGYTAQRHRRSASSPQANRYNN